MGSNGEGRKRKSNFDQVPADDGFRNYMKSKIKLQREQFGLKLPPPPQSPSPRSQSCSAASAHNATPPPTILKRSILSSGGAGKVEDSPAKSVRFHVDVLDDTNSNHNDASSPNTISDVLNSLKLHHPATKRRKRRGRKLSMSRRIQSDGDSGTFAYDTPNKNTESPTDSEQSSTPALGVLDVLDNLQKKHGSSSRRRRSSSSTKRRKNSDTISGGTQSSLERLGKLDSNATESIKRNTSTLSSDGGKSTPTSKRRRDSPRCLGASVLEGLQSSSDFSGKGDATIRLPIDESNRAQPTSTVTSPSPAKSLRKQTHRPDLFFYGVVVLVNGYTNPDAETLKRLLQKHGGDLEKYETGRVTHIIAEQLSTAKANIYKRQKKPTPVCTPNWITESVQKYKLLPHADYLLEGILDKNIFGSKKVKSYFDVQPKQTEAHAGEGREDKRNYEESLVEKEVEKSVTGRPYRWQDKDPHEANHMFAGAKTVGNDPK